MELNAAGNVNFDAGRYGIDFVASPRHADGIVITGPVSENMSEALHICYDAVPEPKIIILRAPMPLAEESLQMAWQIRRMYLPEP